MLHLTRGQIDHPQLPGAPGQLRTVQFDHEGRRLQVASRSGAILDWSVDSHTLLGQFQVPGASFKAMNRTRDGSRWAVGYTGGSVRILDLADRTWHPHPVAPHSKEMEGVRFSPGGIRLFTGAGGRPGHGLGCEDGAPVVDPAGHNSQSRLGHCRKSRWRLRGPADG